MPQVKEYKIISVNTRYYPTEYACPGTDKFCRNLEGQSENPPPTTAVVVEGSIGEHSVFVGHSSDPQWVASWGQRCSFQEALVYFPIGLKKENFNGG